MEAIAVVNRKEEIITPDIMESSLSGATIDRLSHHIRTVVGDFVANKSTIKDELDACRRQARSEYSAEEKTRYSKAGVGCTDYKPMTESKINVAHAMLFDVIYQAGERTWMIEPTPEPDLPYDVIREINNKSMEMLQEWMAEGLQVHVDDAYQLGQDMRQELRNLLDKEGKKRAERMQNIMEDQLLEGGFWEAVESVAKDFCTYPASFMRAAERMERRLRFADGKLKEEDKAILQWERVSPFDVFPSRSTKKLDDDCLCQKVSFSRAELCGLKKTPGYNEDNIDKALISYGRSGHLEDETSSDTESNRYKESDKEQIGYITAGVVEGYEYWGTVPGILLKEWGMKKVEELGVEDTEEYAIHAILIGDYVIYATLNTNPLQRKLFYTASYEDDPDSIWGGSLPRKIRSPQQNINSASRSLQNNMAISSGPMGMMDKNAIDPSCNPTELHPFKLFYYDSSDTGFGSSNRKPIEFFQPDANLGQILPVMEMYKKESDEYSGLPRFTQGDSEGARIGAAKTATGLSMLMNAASKTFKKVISNFDKGFIKNPLEDLYYRNLADPEIDDDAKGDMRIVTKGILGMSLHEQLQLRRQEFLQLVLSSQVLMGILKPDGLVKLLREVVKTLDMPAENLLPTDSQLEKMEQQMEQNKMLQGTVEQLKTSVANGIISPDQFNMMLAMLQNGGQGLLPEKPKPAQAPNKEAEAENVQTQ